ncbi:MAG: efflux RND transporter permease subunit [Verrucomicrobiota bacterium]
MAHSFISACLSRGRTILLVLLLILLAGTTAYLTIPKEANPDVSIPLVYVSIHLEGISPEDAERMLVRPMEKELRGLDGLRELTATAYESGANLVVEFEAGMDIDTVIQDVREKVDIAKAELPADADEPTVNEINLALQPVIAVSLQGNIPERQLVRLARDLRDELEGISEVLEVQLAGDREEVLELVIEPEVLDTYNLNLGEIAAAASRNNVLVAAGTMDNGGGRLAVKVPGLFESPEEFFNLPIKSVGDTVLTVGDIATVRPTFKDATSFSRVNGRPSVTLYVVKRVGENVVAAIAQVRAVVAAEQAGWPAGLEVSFSQDQSDDIRMMLTDLQNNVISAVVLVLVVCIGALGWRSGVLVGIAIPGSFLTGMLVLAAMGLTVNIIVLFALILAVGMLVDGAIVVTELADRKMNEGKPRGEAYLIASQRMAMPIISSTATTLAAFLPLLFWPGVVGEFMKFLPITLVATLSASLLMALVFVPTLGAIFGRPGPASAETMRSLAAAEGGDLTALVGFTGAYVRFLRRAVRRPSVVIGLILTLFVGSIGAYGLFGKGLQFFPAVDPEFASVLVRMRGNLSVEEMDALVREVEARILPVEGFDSVSARTSVSLSGDGISEDTHGMIQLELKDWRERRPGREILKEVELRTVGVPGIRLEPLPVEGQEDLRLRVTSILPMTAGRMQNALLGLQERIALLQPGVRFERLDGTRVLPEARFPAPLAALRLAPAEAVEPAAVRRAVDSWLAARPEEGLLARWDETSDDLRPRLLLETRERLGLVEGFGRLEAFTADLRTLPEVRYVETFSGTVEQAVSVRDPYPLAELALRFDGSAPAAESLLAALVPLLEGVPGVIVEQRAIEAGPPTGKDIQIELSAYNPAVLEATVEEVRGHLETVEGLKEVSDSRPVPGVEWRVHVDRAEASRYGADIQLVGGYVQFVTNGLLLGTYRPEAADDEVDVRARFPGGDRHLAQIKALRVNTPMGQVPVGNFMAETPAPQVGTIERVDGKRVYTVSANVDEDNYLVDSKVRELGAWRREVSLPEGVSWRFRGQDEEQQESIAFLSKAFAVALFLMAIILVTQFNSFYQALLVLVAVVFSTIGVFIGLLITGYPFGIVMNGIGVIALAGIVVNNNIVLIDTYDHLRHQGLGAIDAVLRTCAQRLRPVLLTTITTSLGLLPMVLKMNIDFVAREITFNAPSTQWWVQLATSVSFGLIFATALTLIVTPTLLVVGERVFGARGDPTPSPG